MKIIILGAGVQGVATAYYLVKDGHEVTVVEKHKEPAMESSFANGAQLSYTCCEPWATYANLWKALKWLGHEDAPLLFRMRSDLDLYIWLMKFVANALPYKVARNTLNMLRISFYSRKCMHELLPKLKFDFDFIRSGNLHLFSTKADMARAIRHFSFQRNHEIEAIFKVLNNKECLEIEPAAEAMIATKVGGVYLPHDEVGDIHSFTLGLANEAKALGAKFILNSEIEAFVTSGNKITGIDIGTNFLTADKFVACLGAYTPKLLGPIGVKVPIYPMKGYSITVPVNKRHSHLRVTITDQQRKIVYSPLKGLLRVAGTVEFAGYNHEINPRRIQPILRAAQIAFPNGGDFANAKPWACLRPQTPQSAPILGKLKYDNLFINAGHGSLGWTQAIGSAKVTSDIVASKKPDIKLSSFL